MEDNQLICFEEGKKFLGNDHVTFLKRFYEINLDVSINSLKTSYSRRDWLEVKRNAHSLKGTSSYIGALLCKKLSENLQNACSESSVSEEKINNHLNKLLEHLENLKKYLCNHFNHTCNNVIKIDSHVQKPVFYENKEPSPKIIIKKITPPVLRVLVNENHQKYGE